MIQSMVRTTVPTKCCKTNTGSIVPINPYFTITKIIVVVKPTASELINNLLLLINFRVKNEHPIITKGLININDFVKEITLLICS